MLVSSLRLLAYDRLVVLNLVERGPEEKLKCCRALHYTCLEAVPTGPELLDYGVDWRWLHHLKFLGLD